MLVAGGHKKRLVINLPPRHGKSTLISKYFPAWYLGMFPKRNIAMISSKSNLAEGFGEGAREALRDYGPQLFGTHVDPNHEGKGDWKTKQGGGMFAKTWSSSGITGRNTDIIILDDILSNDATAISPVMREKQWDWFTKTLLQRCEPHTAIIIVMTRWHRQDIVGKLEMEAHKPAYQVGYPWEFIRLPALAEENDPLGRLPGEALWPEVHPKEHLEKLKLDTAPSAWQGAVS